MGIRATAAGELARVDQTTNGSTLFDVAIKTKRGMVNITGFSSDPNAGKAFKTGDVVCMQGNATFKEFNDDVTFQMSKVSVSSRPGKRGSCPRPAPERLSRLGFTASRPQKGKTRRVLGYRRRVGLGG